MDRQDIINELKALLNRLEEDTVTVETDSPPEVTDLLCVIKLYQIKIGEHFQSRRTPYMNYKHALRIIAHYDLGLRLSEISHLEFEIFGIYTHHTTLRNSIEKELYPDVQRTITELRRSALEYIR